VDQGVLVWKDRWDQLVFKDHLDLQELVLQAELASVAILENQGQEEWSDLPVHPELLDSVPDVPLNNTDLPVTIKDPENKSSSS